MGELERIGDVNRVFSLKSLPENLHEMALGYRRMCMEKMGEMAIQGAHKTQYEAEADKEVVRMKEQEEAGRPEFAQLHRAKVDTLRANAAYSRERVRQASMELDFILSRGLTDVNNGRSGNTAD